MSLEGHSILGYRDCGVWFRAAGNQICVQVHNNELSSTPQTQHVADQSFRSSVSIKVNLPASPVSMGNTCSVYHGHTVVVLQVWSLKVEQEVEKNKALTEALQILASEQQQLKESSRSNRRSSALSPLAEDDFYDALSGQPPRTPNISLMCSIRTLPTCL